MKKYDALKKIPIVVLFTIGLIVLIPASPALQPIPHRDSGVFLYVGENILLGKLPYRDLWDHKGPLIYYINALGFSLIPNSYWGTWLIEVFSLSISILLSFSIMKKFFNLGVAFLGTSLWVMALGHTFTTQFGSGNHVEEFALPLYMAQLHLYLNTQSDRTDWRFILIGLFAGTTILLRPNLSSIVAVIFVILFWAFLRGERRTRNAQIHNATILAIGTAIPVILTVLYFRSQNGLTNLYTDALLYNLSYVGSGSLYTQAYISSFGTLGLIMVIGTIAWLMLIVQNYKAPNTDETFRLIPFLVMALPIEIVFSLISGHGYIHYFISWLPLLGLLSCIFIQQAVRFVTRYGRAFSHIFLISIFSMQVIPFARDMHIYLHVIKRNMENGDLFVTGAERSPEWDDIKKLYDIVPKGNTVIFWGNEVQYNFIMDLPAPTKYAYVYPFLSAEYASHEMQKELLDALKEFRPVIVDVQPSLTPPLQALGRWRDFPKAMPIIRYISENYARTHEIPVIIYYYAEGREWKLQYKWIVWIHK